MLAGFDHVVIAVRDIEAARATYETLLGRTASETQTHDGVATAIIALDNVAVELMAPDGEGDAARRLRAALEDGEGLKSLVFATPDIERAHRRCDRLGLSPEPLKDGPPASSRQSFRLNTDRTHGVRIFCMQRDEPLSPSPANDSAILGLDHIVIRSPDLERAAALYGARLDLDMRLDREVANTRLMFFRCGDAVVELAHDASLAHDQLWGLSWRTANAEATHARLASAGLNVSELRNGLKPGTRVFTVRDRTCGVPTLVIEQSA